MRERAVEIETPSGRMETFVTHPEHDGPFPAVIIYMDIWGVREELFEIARRVGIVGYYCMVPDLYYREGRVRHEFRDAQHRMISLHALDEERRQRVIAPGSRLSNAMVVDDTGAILEFVRRGELYCGFAETDPYAPLSMVKELDELLRPCPVGYRYAIHDGAVHGYALPNRDIFDARAAARDWELIFAMFHRQIPPYAA